MTSTFIAKDVERLSLVEELEHLDTCFYRQTRATQNEVRFFTARALFRLYPSLLRIAPNGRCARRCGGGVGGNGGISLRRLR